MTVDEIPITENLLDENQNLVLAFPVTDSQEFDLFFARTLQVDSFYIDYDDEMPQIPSGGDTGSFQRLSEDQLGGTADSVLEIDDSPFTIHHFSVGVSNPDIRIYNAFSDVAQHGHKTGIRISVGDELGFEHSQYSMTPDGVPTTRLEQIKFEGPTLSYGFANDQNDAVKPRLTIFGRSYQIIPVVDQRVQDRIIGGMEPANIVTVGGLQNISPTLPDEWPATRGRAEQGDALRRVDAETLKNARQSSTRGGN
jgi:hypothetical protein